MSGTGSLTWGYVSIDDFNPWQRQGAVANLFFMVTPLVAIQSWLLFNGTLSMMSITGMLLCTAGVAVANYTGPKIDTNRPADAYMKTSPDLRAG